MAFQGSNKPRLSFSIASILRKREGTPPIKCHAMSSVQCKAPGCSHSPCRGKTSCSGLVQDYQQHSTLPWLNYSRYHPPKIPRSRLKPKNYRRKTSGKPRVPFSTSQLMLLEQKYNQTRYVNSSEVSELSSRLNLPERRVKIWFQNRRAREKRTASPDLRESGTSHGAPMVGRPHFSTSLLQHPTINTVWPAAFSQRLQLFRSSEDVSGSSTRLNGAPSGIFRPSPVRGGALFPQQFRVPSNVWPSYTFMRVRECLQNVQSHKPV